LSLYLDASVLVAIITPEALSERAESFLAANKEPLIVSDLASAEFASAISRRVRTRQTTLKEALADLADFDVWLTQFAQSVEIEPPDIAVAAAFLRRLDLPLLTHDAIHIAAAHRLGATLVTLDQQMAANARRLRVGVTEP
jgi:uncharacterized protein